MRLIQQVRRVGVCLCLAAVVSSPVMSQESLSDDVSSGPLTGPPVLDAPFSADAITVARHTLVDGTKIERTATARYYRDGAGRVRIEQRIVQSGASNQTSDRVTILLDPLTSRVYTLDPATRTGSPGIREITAKAIGGGDTFAVPLGGARFLVFSRDRRLNGRGAPQTIARTEEALGIRQIEGIDVVGRRLRMTVPPGQIGNDGPVDILDERWESPELRMLLYARNSDSRTGVIEYRLTNIRRAEPSPDLFVIPSDYTIGGVSGGDTSWIRLEFADPPIQP